MLKRAVFFFEWYNLRMKYESFHTSRFLLDIELDKQIQKIKLTDAYSNVVFADSNYRYSAVVESGGVIRRLQNLNNPELTERRSDRGGRIIVIKGVLGESDDKINIEIEHRFFVPDEESYFEERIVLRNLGLSTVRFIGYRFGFRKKLDKSSKYGGAGLDIENHRMVAVPFRISPDGLKHDYKLDDLYHGLYQYSAPKGFERSFDNLSDSGRERSEAWAWTDGENGLLISKYNPNMIEYSMLESQAIESDIYLNFGGAAPCLFKEPEEASKMDGGSEIAFGKTRYHFYEGLWRRGYYIFRDQLSSLGHGIPDNYNPPIYWQTNKLNKIDPETLSNTGIEAVVLDNSWEMSPGSSIWDTQTHGEASAFIENIKRSELKIGLKITGRAYTDSYPQMYRRTLKGNIGFCNAYDGKPFWEPCYSSKKYKAEKEKRINQIVAEKVDFLRFSDFDWRGPCVDQNHDHLVPTTPGIHSEGVADLIKRVKSDNPNLLIENSDSIWSSGGRYLPIYYLHDSTKFDEINAFGFSENPLDDLLSGKALSLFYYHLAYEFPLSACINIDNDNKNMLAFWWYASTVKHIGLSGKAAYNERLTEALIEYKTNKDVYTNGNFFGLDELIHLHVLSEAGICLLNAFNLTDKTMKKEIEFKPSDVGIFEEVCTDNQQCTVKGGTLIIKLEIPAFDSVRVKFTTK